ncbi:MAG: NADH-quinone oxidoreductase subunit NuoK [Deltaproteobacteria bacterium]|nr:NADH-quinone oxidoreductase subunit NuoK [Deltaproteobacteria bacterium]
MVPNEQILGLAAVLFAVGAIGFVARRNVLIVLMSVELMLNASNLALVGYGRLRAALDGHVFAFLVIAVAAAEAAVGLAIVIAVYRRRRTANLDEVKTLRN